MLSIVVERYTNNLFVSSLLILSIHQIVTLWYWWLNKIFQQLKRFELSITHTQWYSLYTSFVLHPKFYWNDILQYSQKLKLDVQRNELQNIHPHQKFLADRKLENCYCNSHWLLPYNFIHIDSVFLYSSYMNFSMSP